MLAGCSSSSALISPRHRLRSEAPSPQQFNFPMNTSQRLDLPCTASFTSSVAANDDSSKPSSCSSLRQSIRLPPLAIERPNINSTINNGVKIISSRKKSLKRFADDDDDDDHRSVKRKKSIYDLEDREEHEDKDDDRNMELGQFWLNPQVPFPLTFSGSDEAEPEPEDEEDEEYESNFEEELRNSPMVFPFPWIDSIVTEITDLGEKADLPPIGSSSASSSPEPENRTRNNNTDPIPIPNPNPNPSNYLQITGSSGPNNNNNGGEGGGSSSEEAEAMEMIDLVSSCVEAMGAKSFNGISHCIAKLGEMASPWSAGALHRLMAYYTEALALRAARQWPQIFHISLPRDFERQSTSIDDDSSSSSASALRILNQMSPIPRFIHFTSNELFLGAFEGKDLVHIIDFDIKQGLQYPSLLQSLSTRKPSPPSHVRITGIGESKQELNETGDRLASLAHALSLPFEFHPVVDRLEDVRLWMLHVDKDHREAVGVNLALQLHRTLYDGSGGALRDFLGLVKSSNPVAVVVAEQEADHDASRIETRVGNSLRYYAAIFDAMGASGAGPGSAARARVEEMFGREIRNLVACEGPERVERHVGFATWRHLMEERGGFRHVSNEEGRGDFDLVSHGKMLLRMYGYGGGEGQNGYFIREVEGGGITIGWRDQPLFTVSCWTLPPSPPS